MDDALFGNSVLDSPALYTQEKTASPVDVVKAILPNVTGLSTLEIQELASVLMHNFNAVLLNRNATKVTAGSKTRNNSKLGKSAALGYPIKGGKAKARLFENNNTFSAGENVHPEQVLQDAKQVQFMRPLGLESTRAPLMVKNENKQHIPKRSALSELSYGQSHSFTNTGMSKLNDPSRAALELPVGEMNVYQLANSNAAIDQAPLPWLGHESHAFDKLVPPSDCVGRSNLDTIWENGANNLYEGNVDGFIWDSGANKLPYNGNKFTAASSASASSDLWLLAEKLNTGAQNTFSARSENAVARNTFDLLAGGLDNTIPRDETVVPFLKTQTEISKDNLHLWGTGNLPKSCMDVDIEPPSLGFNRAPGSTIKDATTYISQSNLNNDSPAFKRLF
ncbi:hypothetical protein C0J52_00178 [Blattella germanica]|nr:hypothetical protein C0J52_00178 [Blattella germanica]